MEPLRTIEWVPDRAGSLTPGFIRAIDQTRLPGDLRFLEMRKVEEVWNAIKILQVRGAPAIGIAGAMGVVLAAQKSVSADSAGVLDDISKAADYLALCRPTAVNLCWALERMKKKANESKGLAPKELKKILAQEAVEICEEDRRICRMIGEHGLSLL